MNQRNLMLIGGIGLLAYIIYQYGLTSSSVVASAIEYLPVANSAGNEFQCPPGTKFTSSNVMGEGQGYCE